MIIRLDKWICDKSSLSRSDVKAAIKKGRVEVNGQIPKDGSLKLNTDKDAVCLDNKELIYEEHVYYILNKPSGYVTSTSENDGKNVMALLEGINLKKLFPVGRLDKDTTGLLLITDDGALSHELLSPKKHVNKTYLVGLRDDISKEDINALETGVDIGDDTLTKPASVNVISPKTIELTITEGRYHQVKRMLEAVNNKVLSLSRLSFGNIKLSDYNLQEGEFIKIDYKDVIN